MLQLQKSAVETNAHEEVFAQRYDRLLGWALRLTDHDRAQAEDLLHDAFIQFTLSRPDLDEIAHLDAYLCGVLRLLRLSQLRSAARRPTEQLSVVEYDSAELGLRMSDPRDELKVRDELRAVCRYACLRKDSSKAGGVLILRFFHGYYPNEIARVLCGTRRVVDARIASARSEAKLYLTAPERLSFINQRPARKGDPVMTTQNTGDLLKELRATIFESRQGDCLSTRELRRIYQSANEAALTNAQLSHIVSCPDCLDQVNHLLGLPPLADRFPADMLGPEARNGDDDDPPGGGAGSANLRRQSRRRAREVFEHRPKELRIAANGVALGSQRIHAELNEQTIEITQAAPLSFVEVFSEQGLRLLLAPVNGDAAQSARVDLSDDRWLEVTLRFHQPRPTIEIVYRDPLMKSESAARLEEDDQALVSMTEGSASIAARLRAWFAQPRFLLRPALAALAVTVAVVSLILWRLLPAAPSVSAAELLQKSIAAETRILATKDQVAHRTINLEERDAATGQLIARRRIESWQSGRTMKARRLYDERGQLLAGEWRQNDDSRRVAYRQSQRALKPRGEAAIEALWRMELAARDFSTLAGRMATVVEQADAYLLSCEAPDGLPIAAGRVMKATLRINKADLRATEQRLLLHSADADPPSREYRFVETAFERLPANRVPPRVFEIDPELGNSTERIASGTSEAASRAESNETSNNAAAAGLSEKELAELEVEARYLLDQAGANLGEQVKVTRIQNTGIEVSALVETERRKAELLAALAPLRQKPSVALDVATYAEAQRRQARQPNGPVIFSEAEVGQSQIPAAAELRRYFAARTQPNAGRAPEINVEEQIARFANRAQSRAARALRHAWAIRNLIEQIPPEEARSLNPEARGKWRGMVNAHASAIERETAELRRELQPVFFPGVVDEASDPAAGEKDLRAIVERLVELASNHDGVVSRAFSKSAGASASVAEINDRLRRSLREAESLAALILKQP